MKRSYLILCVENAQLPFRHANGADAHSAQELNAWKDLPANTLNELLSPDTLRMVPRDLAEHDAALRQLIGYAVLRVNGRYAHYRRKGTETRLHGSRSLGFGGHIGFPDLVQQETLNGLVDLDRTLELSVRRELSEEIGLLDLPEAQRPIGLLALRDTQVSRVHLGVVIEMEYPREDVVRLVDGDGEIDEVSWSTPEELQTRAAELEGWSAAILPHLRP